MAKAKKKKESQAEQSERFLRAAKEAASNENGTNFERVFQKVVLSARKKRTKLRK